MKIKILSFLILLISIFSSCIAIPLTSDHGEEIDKVRKQLAVGSTTRGEVISIMGEPDVTNDRFIMYLRKEYSGGVVWGLLLPPPTPTGFAGQEYMDLYFGFDNYGTLIEFRADKYDRFFRTLKDDESATKEDTQKIDDCDPGLETCD